MRVQRYLWLACVPVCGFVLTIALIWMVGTQATRVTAGTAEARRAVLYVSKAGKDAENECQDSRLPCQTIQRAIQIAQAGDYIHVAGGMYSGVMYDPSIAMGISATVIITKDISSLLGGYSPDFSTRDIDDVRDNP